MKKNIFISGGAGVIGIELVTKLEKLGHKIYVGDLKSKPLAFSKNILYRQGDLNTLTKFELESFKPNIFIHLAATFERSIETYEFWHENFNNNVRLSNHLTSVVKEIDSVERIVFASSYLIYDKKQYQFEEPQKNAILLNEEMSINPRNLTGMAKLSHEIELKFINEHLGDKIKTVSARIYRGYGLGSRDIISRWVRSLLNDEKIKIYRPEGIFDYMFSRDSAEGILRIALDTNYTGIVNLGTGRPRKVGDIISILKNHFPKMKYEFIESDIKYEASGADMKLFNKYIEWLPEYDLEITIPEIIEYEKKNKANKELKTQNILLSSSNQKIPFYNELKKALNKINSRGKVYCGDITDTVLTSYISDYFWKMPKTDDKNISEIIKGCKERNINLIIPSRDGELLFWSKNVEKFKKEGIEIIISDYNSIQTCLDKLNFYRFGQKNNLNFIKTSENINDIDANVYVVKERYGAGSKNIGIKLNYNQAIEHAKLLDFPIFQEYIKGKEYSCDAWADKKNKIKGLVIRSRDKVVNGESQITTTIHDATLENKITNILNCLKLSGPVVIQFIKDEKGEVNIIECNPRFGGATNTSIYVGLDCLFWSILEKNDQNLLDYNFLRLKRNIKLIRHTTDFIKYDTSI